MTARPERDQSSGRTWVNAVITFVIPMDHVSVADEKFVKQATAADICAELLEAMPDVPYEITASSKWEDEQSTQPCPCEDPRPIGSRCCTPEAPCAYAQGMPADRWGP